MSTRGTTDYPRSEGANALGARLRRLSERIDREAERVYAEFGVDFEQRWFGVLNQLTLQDERAVGELAETIGVTHAAVSQVRAALEKRGLVTPLADPEDARRTLLKLTPAGRRLAAKLAPVWAALAATSRDLDEEARSVVPALDRLEQALDRASLADRVRVKIGKRKMAETG